MSEYIKQNYNFEAFSNWPVTKPVGDIKNLRIKDIVNAKNTGLLEKIFNNSDAIDIEKLKTSGSNPTESEKINNNVENLGLTIDDFRNKHLPKPSSKHIIQSEKFVKTGKQVVEFA